MSSANTSATADNTAILGAGMMGEAILAGLLRDGRDPQTVWVGEKRAERAAELTEKYGVVVVDNTEAVTRADTVLVLVKPGDVESVLAEVAPFLSERHLLASLAAGVPLDFLAAHVPDGVGLIRVMPNTPAMISEGMLALSPAEDIDLDRLARVEAMLSAVGRTVIVPEKYQDAVTAVSGSGPAYLFYVAEAMIEAGVVMGLPRPLATELASQTLVGSALMLRDSGTHPSILRENVTSPGGTTAAALRELDEYKVRAGFVSALEAAKFRSEELAEEMTDQLDDDACYEDLDGEHEAEDR